MSNLMKRLLCVLLALVMVMALCACGGSDDTDTRKRSDKTTEEATTTEETTTEPAPTLVGEWEAYLDYTDYWNDLLAEDLGDEDIISEFTVRVTAKFKESGAVTLEYDEDHTEQMMEALATDMWNILVKTTATEYSITEDEAITSLTAGGISEDNVLEALGLDGLYDYYSGKIKGYYLLDGEELFIAEEEEDVEDAEPIEIEYDGGDTLTLNDGRDLDEIFGEDYEEVLPIVFERIG